MAATTVLQVMDGIEARLATIAGLRVSDIKPDQINPPQAVVGVPPIDEYRIVMQRGRFTLRPTVTVFVSASVDRVGQRALAEYVDVSGAKSIPAAIEGDRTLGGVVDDCIVESFEPLGLEDVGAIGFYGGLWRLLVVARGA